jgi:hypothetical protein
MMRTRGLLAAVFVALTACAAQSFQPRFKAPARPNQTVVVGDLARPKPREEQPVAVGLTTDPMRLFAWDLHTGLLWEKPVNAKSAPLVAADAVVLQEADGIVVRDLASGERRLIVDDKGALIGADAQGRELAISIAYANDKTKPGSIALVEGDHVRWKQILNLPVGVPAVSGEYVLVPWATQRLSVLTVGNGLELARFHYKSTVMGEALVDRGQLYVGQLGLFPVTEELLAQPNTKRTAYTPLKRSLPGQPPLLRDGYAAVADPDNASHRLNVDWRIHEEHGVLSTENDLLALRFYRLLFALNAKADEIRWVRSFDHDLIGSSILPGGMLLADTGGTVRFVDSQGVTSFMRSLGRELRVLTFRPGSWLPDATSTADAATANMERPQGSLREQLYAAAALEDDRLGGGRAYAAANLSHFDDADATSELIMLCSDRKSPEPVRNAACVQLRDRQRGQLAVLNALRVRASFLEGTDAPPVGPLAQAAAKMQLKQAGPLLVSHIEDPNTPVPDLVALFDSLRGLGERSAAVSVERFVRLHHAEPEGSELMPALASGLHTLAALRARAQRQTLVDIAADPLTPKSTRDQAQAALAELDAPVVSPPTAAASGAPQPSVREPAEQDDVQTDPRPYALTPAVVTKALTPLRDKLGRCLNGDPSHPNSGRSSLVVDGNGNVEGVFVLPATLQPCVEPLLRSAKFPSTRLGRQRITHIFTNAKAISPRASGAPKPKVAANVAVRPTAP